jgi:hypothetical protein
MHSQVTNQILQKVPLHQTLLGSKEADMIPSVKVIRIKMESLVSHPDKMKPGKAMKYRSSGTNA